MRGRPFTPGHDPRRQHKGRPPSAATIRRAIARTIYRDAEQIAEHIRTLAASGDPQGLLAAAVLLTTAAKRHE
jgi:hypothetical protein